jgi:threonine/homoserine/homoserine lactone efflux protein
MAFNATYTAGDITSAANDGIARGFIVAAGFAGVAVLIFILAWGMKRFKKQ